MALAQAVGDSEVMMEIEEQQDEILEELEEFKRFVRAMESFVSVLVERKKR